jgi:hypothetical protein
MDGMALFNVANFMAQDSGKLIITGHGIHKALIDIDEAAGTSKSIDVLCIEDFEGIGNLPRRMSGKGFSDAVDAACHFIILIESILGFQGFSRPFPHFNFLFFTDHSRLGRRDKRKSKNKAKKKQDLFHHRGVLS